MRMGKSATQHCTYGKMLAKPPNTHVNAFELKNRRGEVPSLGRHFFFSLYCSGPTTTTRYYPPGVRMYIGYLGTADGSGLGSWEGGEGVLSPPPPQFVLSI